METKPVESKKVSTEEVVKNFLAVQKVSRYGKAKQTQFVGKMDSLMSELGIGEPSRIDVIAGNSQDKTIVYGLVLANVVLTKDARTEFVKGLTAQAEEEDKTA